MSLAAVFNPPWTDRPLWSMFVREKNVGHPKEQMLSVFREHGVVAKDSLENFNKTAEDRNIYQLVAPGWLVVNRMKAFQGSVGVSGLRGIVSGHYICFRPTHEEDSRYLNWLLRSVPYATEYARLSRGVRPGQAEIDNDELRGLPVYLPGLAEQRRIADFLDDQVGKIGRAASLAASIPALARERLLSTLADELDEASGPTVPLRSLSSRITSGPRGWGDLVSEVGTPFIRIGNLPADGIGILDQDVQFVDAPRGLERERTRLCDGDVLISITAALGLVGVVDQAWMVGANVSQHVALVRPRPTLCVAHWLGWALQSPRRRDLLSAAGYGGTKVGLGLAEIGAIRIPAWDRQRQELCAARLKLAEIEYRGAVAAAERLQQLFAERKRALITACVTGEFDVTTAGNRATNAALSGMIA